MFGKHHTLKQFSAGVAVAASLAVVAVPSALGAGFITDTLGGNGHPQQVQGYRLITDTLAPGGGAPIEAAPASPSFSWNDAAVGAGTALGALLVLLGGTLVVARRQGRLAI